MEDLEKKILEDIEKTGFVTELKTVSLLIDHGWSTKHSSTYEDKDHNLSREIDVIATKVEFVKELNFRLIFYLIIETKKSERPWIIFTTDRKFSTLGWAIMHKGYNDKKKEKYDSGGEYFSTIFDIYAVSQKSIREDRHRVGKAFHELGKTPGEKSKIYDSLISVSKASKYYCEKYSYDINEPKDFDPNKTTDLAIYLPTVVLDGLLYEVYNEKSGQIKTQKESYIPIDMQYSSPNYREGSWDVNFHPDIVTFDHLTKHLDNIEIWRQSMLSQMTETLKKLGKKPKKDSL